MLLEREGEGGGKRKERDTNKFPSFEKRWLLQKVILKLAVVKRNIVSLENVTFERMVRLRFVREVVSSGFINLKTISLT